MSNIKDIPPDVVRAILLLRTLSRCPVGGIWDGTKVWCDIGWGNASLHLGNAMREMAEAGVSGEVFEAAIRECLQRRCLTYNGPKPSPPIEDVSLSKDDTFDAFAERLELLDIGGKKPRRPAPWIIQQRMN